MSKDKQRNADNQSPTIARYKPYYFKLVSGKSYFWCSCGRSSSQPFCDGSHKDTPFEPVRYKAESNDEVLFCGCKHSRSAPFCDGAHNNLRDTYAEDDPDSECNKNIPLATHRIDGRLHLNGRCYVARTEKLPAQSVGNTTWASVISADTGAYFQSQFHFSVSAGASPSISFGDLDAVLLTTSGQGTLKIGDREFSLIEQSGLYVRPGESFVVENSQSAPLCFYVSVCPQADKPTFSDRSADYFDSKCPNRTVAADDAEKHKMADRSFQILVDKTIGSEHVTQFIGHIPLSKAETHRHLYEEALIIVSGEGCLWTEDMKGNVRAGDVVFLPAQQPHSLQSTSAEGMVVAGVIYPGGNPDINY